jgi:hypothetical protein
VIAENVVFVPNIRLYDLSFGLFTGRLNGQQMPEMTRIKLTFA